MGQPLMPIKDVGKRRTDKAQKYFLDDAGRQMILDLYDGKTATVTMLAERLQVPRWAIRRWAVHLGLTKIRANKRWTPEEERELEVWLHRMSIKALAEKFGRTETAILRKAALLGLTKCGEGYTMHGLADALGCARETVAQWVKRGWLKGTRRQTERTSGDIWYFSDAAVRKFIMQHPYEVDPRRAEWGWLVDVLTGGLGPLAGDKSESE
jgi:hypothetical protein